MNTILQILIRLNDKFETKYQFTNTNSFLVICHFFPHYINPLQTLSVSMFVHPFGQMLYVWKCLQKFTSYLFYPTAVMKCLVYSV